MRRLGVWVCIALALLASGCGPVVGAGTRPAGVVAHSGRAELLAYSSCTQLLTQVRAEALSEIGPYGLPYAGPGVFVGVSRDADPAPPGTFSAAAEPSAASDSAGSAGTAGAGGGVQVETPGFSATNDQEQGVDEPDLVKTDGHLLVALRQSPVGIQVADVGPAPRLRGFLSLGGVGSPSGLFLVGSQAIVLASGLSPGPLPSATSSGGSPAPDLVPDYSPAPTTDVLVVSLADPDHPVVARSFVLQGSEVDARLVAGHVEVVVVSAPQLPFVTPTDGSAAASQEALAANRALVRSSRPAEWLPSVTSEPTGITRPIDCSTVMRPVVASGLDTVSVVPIDPGSNQPLPTVTVMGDATTVYADTSSLYVATSPWPQIEALSGVAGAPSDQSAGSVGTTEVHGFDLSDPAAPRYIGSGEVPGTLIGQYALSEYQGYLRVATTVGTASPPPLDGTVPTVPSDNRVTILQPRDGTLAIVGAIGGLGGGEKIYAVRFVGPVAFVVTFRQTDPLYVLDLNDPAHPQATGQLELTGYSSFLQPLTDNLMLGVGEEVDQNLRRVGLQVSLFDVSDPKHPSLLSKVVYPGSSSTAESDPHALLYWAPSDLVILPVEQGDEFGPWSTSTAPFSGAVALHVGQNALTETGRLIQPVGSGPGPVSPLAGSGASGGSMLPVTVSGPDVPVAMGQDIERALVVGNMIYTVSESGIMVSNLTTFAQVDWLPYS